MFVLIHCRHELDGGQSCAAKYVITALGSMISGAQIRAGRALLGISATALAEQSSVDLRTVQRFEAAEGIPPSRSGTLQRIKETLETLGVTFIGDPETAPGVQLRPASGAKRKKS